MCVKVDEGRDGEGRGGAVSEVGEDGVVEGFTVLISPLE